MANVRSNLRNRAMMAIALCVSLFLACAASLTATQKEKKNKKSKAADSSTTPIIPMTDQQQIDYLISEMLGAWQIGDVERMHKNYADDVTVVNGGWAPPVTGWAKYAEMYQQTRAKMQQVRLDRSNTYIWINGNTAWACYQWEFSAVMNGEPTGARGQTTLVLEKRENRWLIVHDHSNVVQTVHGSQPAQTPAATQPSPQEKPGT